MKTSDKLAEIIAHKRKEVQILEPHETELRRVAVGINRTRGFRRCLELAGPIGLIAEIKKASPSAGVIAENFNPINQAREYARGGAHALSILTDEAFFQGSLS